jgi:hypothetical protein
MSTGLKLVEAMDVSEDDTYQPVQISTPQQLSMFWPLAAPHLDRCVKGALHGEYTTQDLYDMVSGAKAVLFVVTNDPTGAREDTDVSLAWVVEPVLYPKLNAINILALGGRDFSEVQRQHWDDFKGWAYMNGARAIEASVSPAMARILKRWGYKPVYQAVRVSLEKTDG